MKKVWVLILMFLFSGLVFANTIYYPANVKEIKSVEYSTGGGDSMMIYIKVFCLMKNDTYNLFMVSKGSVAGYLKLSRFTIPKQINFVKDNNLNNEIKWE